MENLLNPNWVEQYTLLFVLLGLWSLVWKGFALWRAARSEQKVWFVVMLVVNTLGLLEIVYLYLVNPKRK